MIAAQRMMLAVPKDDGGVRTAIAEMFEESLYAEERARIERQAEAAENRERMLESAAAKRSLEDGYYVWAGHLMVVERMLALGIRCPLTADEARGLGVLRDAAVEFARKHPPCPHCGRALVNPSVKQCSSCGKQLEQGG